MTRMWSTRLLALGAFALALGCRSHPLPACNTPLLPEDVINKPAPAPAATPPASGAKLPGDPGIQPPKSFTKLPENRTPTAIPTVSPDSLEIKPPADVAPRDAKPQAAPAPVIKPLLVDPPKPPAGPDGFAPAPILGLPEPEAALVAKPQAAVVRPLPLKAGERFGHAADYKWVAGVLDYHQKGGYWSLRYADSGEDDPWGGKVRLLADERLSGFASGDAVYVEGELLAPRSAAETAAYPPYRITDVRLVEKGR